jgi:glycosyltransferase involved in cell wall biosynthesis
MALTIVSAAYPLVPVGADTVGGSEQVLARIDAALVARGHRSIVVASRGSSIAGTLVETPGHVGHADAAAWSRAYAVHHETIQRVIDTVRPDVVHLHGADQHSTLPKPGPAVLVTLHLPASNYPEHVLHPARSSTFYSCGSRFARRQYDGRVDAVVIPYAVPLERFKPGPPKEDFVLALGRICHEKGFHLALDAARKANLPLILGGKVPPFREHQDYFDREIAPRLDGERRFLGPIPLAQRADLLARARCLVVPSLWDETGPLVALEALASGTPVVARPVGAMLDNLEQGKTALFVEDVDDMACALHEVKRLDSRECRRAAEERFCAELMVERYIALYEHLAAQVRAYSKSTGASQGTTGRSP